MTLIFPLLVRQAFELLPEEASHIATVAPRWAEVFTPADHQGALDPNRGVIVGDRGTGKSFWSSVLINSEIKNLVAQSYPKLDLKNVESRLGFSEAEMVADHPGRAEIADVVSAGYSAEDLWRAVLLRLSPLPVEGLPPKTVSWKEMSGWVKDDPGRRNAQIRQLDNDLVKNSKIYVLIFDALDVVADDWIGIRAQIAGLIRLALSLRALQAIRIKLFIRPDMADDRRLWEVGDASKLRQREILLKWKRRDLYGLLWTLLANVVGVDSQPGEIFRNHCEKEFNLRFILQDGSWRAPSQLVDDEDIQQKVFRALAGDYMGAGPTKGDTYKWVTNHLSDAAGFAAPRSFLLAMKEGSNMTRSKDTVLDKVGIESGARDASKVRVAELAEDYRWMTRVLQDMEALVVPLTRQELMERWKQRKTLEALKDLADNEVSDQRFIPPGDVLNVGTDDEAYTLLVEQLVRLKIFFLLSDGRINMPDLFRLQANVKRKGGMRPRV